MKLITNNTYNSKCIGKYFFSRFLKKEQQSQKAGYHRQKQQLYVMISIRLHANSNEKYSFTWKSKILDTLALRNNKYTKKYWMDQQIQQLQQDGVDMVRFTTKNSSYHQCPQCQTTLSLDKKVLPALLKCGHVCCQQCATEGKPICFICCNRKNIKILKYTVYLKPIPRQKFGITIKIQGKQQEHNIQDVPGDNTVEAVLKYYKGFNQFAQKTKEDQILVEIGTKKMEYKKIKETAIERYLKANAAQKNIRIRISLKENRSLGGGQLK